MRQHAHGKDESGDALAEAAGAEARAEATTPPLLSLGAASSSSPTACARALFVSPSSPCASRRRRTPPSGRRRERSTAYRSPAPWKASLCDAAAAAASSRCRSLRCALHRRCTASSVKSSCSSGASVTVSSSPSSCSPSRTESVVSNTGAGAGASLVAAVAAGRPPPKREPHDDLDEFLRERYGARSGKAVTDSSRFSAAVVFALV